MLGNMGAEAVLPLMTVWSSSVADARRRAAQALVAIGDSRAFEVFVEALRSAGFERERAATLLRDSEDIRILEPFINLLSCDDPYLQYCAAEVMIRMGDERAVEGLCKLLHASVSGIRISAVRALAHIKATRAAPHLREALQDPDRFVARHAAQALAEISRSDDVATKKG